MKTAKLILGALGILIFNVFALIGFAYLFYKKTRAKRKDSKK